MSILFPAVTSNNSFVSFNSSCAFSLKATFVTVQKAKFLVFVNTDSIKNLKKKIDFKIVELMDRSIASVAVCPVFIVHFKSHIEKRYLQSGMDTINHIIKWTLLFYSRLKHSEVIHCVAAPTRNSH